MRHFLIHRSNIIGKKAILDDPSEIHHLVHVLRLTVGEEIVLLDGQGFRYLSKILSVVPRKVECEILSSQNRLQNQTEFEIILAVALIKKQAMDLIIEKAVEFGVSELIPLKTERTVVNVLDVDHSRQQRWYRIAQAAAKQSGQVVLPTIKPTMEFTKFLQQCPARQGDTFLLVPDSSTRSFAELLLEKKDWKKKKLCLLIGPEGGWSSSEVSKAIQADCLSVYLSSNSTLRCETAVIAALALVTSIGVLHKEDKS